MYGNCVWQRVQDFAARHAQKVDAAVLPIAQVLGGTESQLHTSARSSSRCCFAFLTFCLRQHARSTAATSTSLHWTDGLPVVAVSVMAAVRHSLLAKHASAASTEAKEVEGAGPQTSSTSGHNNNIISTANLGSYSRSILVLCVLSYRCFRRIVCSVVWDN